MAKKDIEYRGWIGVDLDGTLAYSEDSYSDLSIGDPVPEMLRRVKKWLADGWRVKVFTARVAPRQGRDVAAITTAIQEWCLEHLGQPLEVTCRKDYDMIELWDDRAVQVEHNKGSYYGDSIVEGKY